MIVVDEVHHCSAPMFHLVINNIPAKYRIGVTGTIERRDGKHILIYDTLGEKLIDIGAKDAKNRITNFDFRIINTNIRFEIPTRMRWTGQKREQTLDITGCISKLTQDTDRNNIIVSEVSRVIENGRFPLVLSDRIDHNKNIYEHIVSLGYKAVLLIGSTRKKTNWEEIRQDTSIQCIVGNTKIASEALDLPRLSDIFLTCPSSNLPQIKQRLGRIRRVLEGKPLPMVHDVCDNLAYYVDEDGRPVYLLQMLAAKRIRFYKKLIREYDESGGLESVV
jgi:superfamily II DNA or RNA helicase